MFQCLKNARIVAIIVRLLSVDCYSHLNFTTQKVAPQQRERANMNGSGAAEFKGRCNVLALGW